MQPGTDPEIERLASGEPRGIRILATNRLVLLAAVPLFLVLAVVSYITIQFAANERAAQAWVRHTYQVMDAERQVLDDIQTAETGMRGFLLTRDPEYAAGYRSLAARVPRDLRKFRELTADNPVQQARAGRLEALMNARLRGLQAGVAAPTFLNAPPPPAMVSGLQRGRQQMTAIRGEIAGGLAEEQRLLAERDAGRREQETLEIAFAIGAMVLTLGILMIAAALLVRNNVSLAQAERARANEAAILQATLESVREGIAYFTSEGLLCAFNASFFRLLGAEPTGWRGFKSHGCRNWRPPQASRFFPRLGKARARWKAGMSCAVSANWMSTRRRFRPAAF